MLLAAFTNDHKISFSNLTKKYIDELNEKAKKHFSEKNTKSLFSFSKQSV